MTDTTSPLSRYALLEAELRICKAQGQVGPVHMGIKDKLLCTQPTEESGWSHLAMTLSLNLPGQFWVGSNSLAWVCGKSVVYVAPYERLEGIKEARSIVNDCTGLPLESLPCSAAGCARKMLEWVGIRQTSARSLDKLIEDNLWSYQYCDPRDLPMGYLWDITSCYFSLLQRAPSPKVLLLNDQLFWCPVTKDERERWEKMLRYAAPHKGMRNSFIGQMYSSTEGLFFSKGKPNQNAKNLDELDYLRTSDGLKLYQTGAHFDDKNEAPKPEEKKTPPGPLRPLACLVIRSSYELCALAREEEQAIYSNTDCVITTSQHAPKIWGRYGLKVALKGAGATNVHAIGYYKVGERETIPYKQGNPKRRPNIKSGQDDDTSRKVKLFLKGETWCDKWLESDLA